MGPGAVRAVRGRAGQAVPRAGRAGRRGAPAKVVDLGCGDGSLTATLAARWPSASVLGVDSSEEMLAEAAAPRSPTGCRSCWSGSRTGVRRGRSTCWCRTRRCSGCRDTVACCPGWSRRWRRAAGWRSRCRATSRRRRTRCCGRCATRRAGRTSSARPGGGRRRRQPAEYVRELAALGCRVDAWETTYAQVLHRRRPGADVDARDGAATGVRAAVQPRTRPSSRRSYGALLREAYPPQPYGTVLPFRRIFAVAQRAGVILRLHTSSEGSAASPVSARGAGAAHRGLVGLEGLGFGAGALLAVFLAAVFFAVVFLAAVAFFAAPSSRPPSWPGPSSPPSSPGRAPAGRRAARPPGRW